MAAERSELEDSSDDGGRRGQQQRRLWLLCDFVVAGGIGCSKGVAAIGGRWGSDVHGCCRGGQQRYGVGDRCCRVQFVVGHDQDSWQHMIGVGYDLNRLQRKITAALLDLPVACSSSEATTAGHLLGSTAIPSAARSFATNRAISFLLYRELSYLSSTFSIVKDVEVLTRIDLLQPMFSAIAVAASSASALPSRSTAPAVANSTLPLILPCHSFYSLLL
ncbi:hypothetical protein OPV22_026631 [Ensete ventricosum]|uniref:Uncharacterized protein n=1 Tax=Ensete ventricosum TaxID=4639 RepID=A0AAV8QFX2_ENSVE|nr:hypothetical protein OPV22_026631 [Ensete ventricosum]